MVAISQIEAGTRFASIQSTVSIATVPASYRNDGYVIASRAVVSGVGDRAGGSLSVLQSLRVTSFWEATLIAVLFLLISALVGFRTAQTLSKRDVEIESLPLITDGTVDTDGPDRAPSDDHWASERYLSPETPPELLSDEGKVVRLLVANRGRIRQHRIADETGWSKSKVSRICSQMHADDLIEKRSVGRENLITLSDRTRDEETGPDEVENPLP